MEGRLGSLEDGIEALKRRLEMLEQREEEEEKAMEDEKERAVRQMRKHWARVSSSPVFFRIVPSNYYDLPLRQRKELVKAPSEAHLCKSILVHNAGFQDNKEAIEGEGGAAQWRGNEYILLVVQYVARMSFHKVLKFAREVNGNVSRANSRYVLAPSEDSDRLSGFLHNAVSPIGFRDSSVPVVLDSRIAHDLRPAFLWLGGGHVDVKMGCSVEAFIAATNCHIAEITQ